jgi:hypothetical protein
MFSMLASVDPNYCALWNWESCPFTPTFTSPCHDARIQKCNQLVNEASVFGFNIPAICANYEGYFWQEVLEPCIAKVLWYQEIIAQRGCKLIAENQCDPNGAKADPQAFLECLDEKYAECEGIRKEVEGNVPIQVCQQANPCKNSPVMICEPACVFFP